MKKEKIKDAVAETSGTGFNSGQCRRWLSGIPYEVAFWRSYYRNKRSMKQLFGWSQYRQECRLDNFDVASYISGLGVVDPVIVDVGCALSYAFGSLFGGKEYPVIYLDPLAPFYNKILDDYSLDLPKIKFGMGETLSLVFPADSVSLFHIRNALDHSVRPITVIWQALIALHNGGVLYLNHKPNEAEHEGYIGFHQYNIDCIGGRLTIWNREERIDVATALEGYAEVEASVTDEGRIIGVVRKTAPIPADHPAVEEGNRYASGMLQTMMTYLHSAPASVSYQLRRGAFSVGHGFMRMLPTKLVRRLKRIVTGK
ncbi:MAG: hypothetical protein HDS68_09435 [Bacteroidales bacterium]|nr:hypothetical protein [Bacteroidales bacterium]